MLYATKQFDKGRVKIMSDESKTVTPFTLVKSFYLYSPISQSISNLSQQALQSAFVLRQTQKTLKKSSREASPLPGWTDLSFQVSLQCNTLSFSRIYLLATSQQLLIASI